MEAVGERLAPLLAHDHHHGALELRRHIREQPTLGEAVSRWAT
ncbi:hypothetical protein ACIBG8_05945 [Nonomuraea sp. NPDC050556]